MVASATRLTVPPLIMSIPCVNCWRLKFSVPGKDLLSVFVPMNPLSTSSVWPEAICRKASLAAKLTTGTDRRVDVPVPLARMPPEVTVSVVGLRPERPPKSTEPETLLVSARALIVWLPVSELEVLNWALKVALAGADRMLVATL